MLICVPKISFGYILKIQNLRQEKRNKIYFLFPEGYKINIQKLFILRRIYSRTSLKHQWLQKQMLINFGELNIGCLLKNMQIRAWSQTIIRVTNLNLNFMTAGNMSATIIETNASVTSEKRKIHQPILQNADTNAV